MSKIAMLVDHMFEDSEFRVPYDRLRAAGHQVEIIGLHAGNEVIGKKNKEHVKVEKAVADVRESDYDALVIPGGFSPDSLRTNREAVWFTRTMADANKLIAAVCHAPSLLIEADLVEDRVMTSWPSIRTDLVNAGAKWVDRDVVVDGNIITSRNPGDLPVFSDTIIRQLSLLTPELPKPELAAELPAAH